MGLSFLCDVPTEGVAFPAMTTILLDQAVQQHLTADKPCQNTLQLKYEIQINADMHPSLPVTQKQCIQNPVFPWSSFCSFLLHSREQIIRQKSG